MCIMIIREGCLSTSTLRGKQYSIKAPLSTPPGDMWEAPKRGHRAAFLFVAGPFLFSSHTHRCQYSEVNLNFSGFVSSCWSKAMSWLVCSPPYENSKCKICEQDLCESEYLQLFQFVNQICNHPAGLPSI